MLWLIEIALFSVFPNTMVNENTIFKFQSLIKLVFAPHLLFRLPNVMTRKQEIWCL